MNSHIQRYYHCCFADKLWEGVHDLLSVPSSEATPTVNRLQTLVRNRFITQSRSKPIYSREPTVRRVIRCYHAYYHKAIFSKVPGPQAEQVLRDDLLAATSDRPCQKSCETLDELEEAQLKPRLGSLGLHFLGGKTTPYYGAYIWRHNEVRNFTVGLPDGSIELRVVFMRGFLEQSWMNYITFGAYRASGWATSDAIYCDYSAYSRILEQRAFEEQFLLHEAQHVFDKQRYGLEDECELEMRAKLAQIILGTSPSKIYRWIAREASNDPRLPHPYSSFLIQQAINPNAAWISADVVRERAEKAFEASTERIRRASP
jgi:hypothetical protein